MKSNLGTQPVNGERMRIRVIATLFDIIGGSPVNAEQSKIDKEVKEVINKLDICSPINF